LAHQDRLNIAVFIDFDNIEIGVKSTLNQQFDAGTILDAIKERGEVVTKIAYADWTRAGEYSRALTQHAIRLVQRNLTPGGDKNGADINLALDALEMAFTHPHINAYVIVGGDSDFLSLVEKLKQYDKKVFVVGGRAFTSIILQRNCHEFIAYENLVGVRRGPSRGGRAAATTATLPIAQAFPIVRRALKILADREVSPQTGLLKSTLLQLDSTFSERSYGASSFLDFAEKLAEAGLVQLKHSGRSVMVELNPAFDDGDLGDAKAMAGSDEGASAPDGSIAAPDEAPSNGGTQPPAEGVRRVGRILAAATGARWPMYLRNVKQLLRAADGGFDERQFGFSGLMDLMRACQREGIVRLERDRRGGLRVFQGAALERAADVDAAPEPHAAAETADLASDVLVPEVVVESPGFVDIETVAVEGVGEPVDSTAELLGRAAPKRPRGRATPAAGRKPARAAGARSTSSPRRASRPRKAAGELGSADNS
jgi:uncharacterized LabA/DUF88 family protein